MRFRQRTKVDLPQPEGPITAVTCLSAMLSVIPFRTSLVPNEARRFSVRIFRSSLLTETSSQRGFEESSFTASSVGPDFFECFTVDGIRLVVIVPSLGGAPVGAQSG